MPRFRRLIVLLSLALVLPTFAFSQRITDIGEIKSLDAAQAAESRPVTIEGIVVHSQYSAFVLHDGKNGVFVYGKDGNELPYGTRVRVDGETDPGDFAPSVHALRIEILGTGEVPPLRLDQPSSLESGSLDCQWVEIEGWLRNAKPKSQAVHFIEAYATLATGTTRVNIAFSSTDFATVQSLVGSRVRLQAACLHYFNSNGQLYGTRLIVPTSGKIEVTQQALPAESVPIVPIQSLLRYSPRFEHPRRVHVQGIVTYTSPNLDTYIQEGSFGVFVQRLNLPDLQVGDSIDLVGFVRRGLYSPEIEDALIRQTESANTVVPRAVAYSQARTADGTLVSIEGILIDRSFGAQSTELIFKTEEQTFSAFLPQKTRPSELPSLGSSIQLTGVARVNSAPEPGAPYPWEPNSFELLLRDRDDIVLVQAPPPSPYLWVIIFVAPLCLLAIIAAGSLWWHARKQEQEQERFRLIRETEFAAMIKERMRLAREIHDNLAQGFTAVSVQLESAKHLLPSESSPVFSHLEKARELVKDSLADARRSVKVLRHQSLTNAEFLAALQRTASRILEPKLIEFRSELNGDIARIGAEAENELISIAGEAITNIARHANATQTFVRCDVSEATCELIILDDGSGFDSENLQPAGFGLKGMKERTERLGGSLCIESSPTSGTRICITLPIS